MMICSHDGAACIDRRHHQRESIVKYGYTSFGILVLSLIPACIAGAFGGWPVAAVAWVSTLFIGGGFYGLGAALRLAEVAAGRSARRRRLAAVTAASLPKDADPGRGPGAARFD
jgi:hypothetical protein